MAGREAGVRQDQIVDQAPETAAAELREADGTCRADELEPLRERFWDAVCDDLNAPRALAVTWEAVRSEGLDAAERWALLREFDAFLGLDLQHAKPRAQVRESDPRIDGLIAEREAARARRDFAESDRIRDLLADEGISIEDTPEGPRWRRG